MGGDKQLPVRLYAPTRHFLPRRAAEWQSLHIRLSEVVSTPAEEQSLSLKSPRQALPLSREFTTLKDKCQTFAPSAALRGIMFSAINGNLGGDEQV